MNTINAVQNLDNLIATSRMTREEHVVLQQSLMHLSQKASTLDKQKQEKKDLVNEKGAQIPLAPLSEGDD